MIVKLQNTKWESKALKVVIKKRKSTYKGINIRLNVYFSKAIRGQQTVEW